jgi:type II secretion system protein L
LLLFITLPDLALARFDAETTARWTLCDPTGNAVRSAETSAAEARRIAPQGSQIIALVPAGRVVFIETLLPAVSAAKRDQLVRYAIEDKLTIDPSTVHAVVLDARDASDTAKSGKSKGLQIAAAIDRTWFGAALSWLNAAGVVPRAAFAETALLPVAKGEWSVQLAAKNAYAKRADGFAYAIDAGTATQPPFALTLALNEVAEKPSAISLFLNTTDATSEADRKALAANWQAALGVPVRLSITSRDAASSQAFKQLATLKSGNLLIGEFAPAHAANAWLKSLKPALALASLIALLHIAFVVGDNWQLERKRINIENDMRATFQTAFPQATTIIDPALQMQRNLETLQRERGVWRDDDSRRALARFATLRETMPNIEVMAVNIKKGDAKLTAKVGDANSEKNEATMRDLQKEIQARAASLPDASVARGAQAGTVEIGFKMSPSSGPLNAKAAP